MAEVWRNVKDFEDYYKVSDQGRIWSLFKKKILKPYIMKTGYCQVTLYGEIKKNYLVHTLVAHAFPEICGEPFPGAQINHLNEDKSDNRAINLRFCSASENINWGTHNQKVAKAHATPICQYTLDGEFIKEWESMRELERQTGFAHSNISKACKGKYKQFYGYVWKLK